MNKSPRWSRNKRPTGLAGIGSGIAGYSLKMDGIIYAMISPAKQYSDSSWYWYTMQAEPHINTCDKCAPLEICKFQAMEHVKKYLATQKDKSK